MGRRCPWGRGVWQFTKVLNVTMRQINSDEDADCVKVWHAVLSGPPQLRHVASSNAYGSIEIKGASFDVVL